MEAIVRLFMLSASITLALFGPQVQANDQVRVASSYRQGTAGWLGLEALSESLRSCQDSSIVVNVFDGGALGSPAETAIALQAGSVDIAVLPSFALQQFHRATAVLSFPFVFNNRAHWKAVLDGPAFDYLNNNLDPDYGLRVVGYMGGEQYGILSTEPIIASEDIAGRNIRTAMTDSSAFQALGANAVRIALGETFPALQAGAIDGTEVSAQIALEQKIFQFATNFSATNHRIFTDLIVVNSLSFERLSNESRFCLGEAVATASEIGRDAVITSELAAFSELSNMGVTIRVVEDREALFEKVSEATQSVVNQFGAAELYAIIASAAACPNWCSNSTCGDNECKTCRTCE